LSQPQRLASNEPNQLWHVYKQVLSHAGSQPAQPVSRCSHILTKKTATLPSHSMQVIV